LGGGARSRMETWAEEERRSRVVARPKPEELNILYL
jgi:hypothetical protein